MASPFSGSSGRKAAMAVMQFAEDARKRNWTDIKDGRKASLSNLDAGYKAGVKNYNAASDLYDPYVKTGLAAFDQYADASGVNGQEGHDRAVANFRAGPGYEWAVDQSTDAVARKASSLGALGSGNTMAAISDRAGHMADQEYDDYLGRLDNIGKTGFAATGAQAGIQTGIGDLYTQRGRDKANVYQQATGMKLNSAAGLDQMYAQALHGGMTAGQNAAANRWSMGMNLLNTAAGLAGKFAGM